MNSYLRNRNERTKPQSLYNVKNSFGGLGRASKMDAYGKAFKTSDEAWNYAFEHGYLREYFTAPELRARRMKQAYNPKSKESK